MNLAVLGNGNSNIATLARDGFANRSQKQAARKGELCSCGPVTTRRGKATHYLEDILDMKE